MSMTKGERDQLLQLVKKREKVMKTKAEERSLALLAQFDAESATIHHYDDDAVWAEAVEKAKAVIEEAQVTIAARCKELGIPTEFAPGLVINWHGRGHNEVASRRTELRRAAKSKIEAVQKEAVAKIEEMSLEAQTAIIRHGLESEAAKSFLETMPTLEQLMPPVSVIETQALMEAKRAERKQLNWQSDYLN